METRSYSETVAWTYALSDMDTCSHIDTSSDIDIYGLMGTCRCMDTWGPWTNSAYTHGAWTHAAHGHKQSHGDMLQA